MLELVVGAGTIVAAILWVFLKKRDPQVVKAHALASQFREKVVSYRHHATTLQAHSDEYRAVFADPEWRKLTSTLARLEGLYHEIQALLTHGKAERALKILETINNPKNASSPLAEAEDELHHVEELIHWERSVHGLLSQAVRSLEVASTNVTNLTRPKNYSTTSPTLVTLADIKKVLLEDEELRRMSLK
jgi:hypothetical protein